MRLPTRPTSSFFIAFCLISLLSALCTGQESEEVFQMIQTAPGLSLHKEMFMLPVTYSDEYNNERTEAVFQISAKHRLFETRFYFAYTQISFWQAYDARNSAPFRETNYNPEIFYRTKRLPLHSGAVGADIGLEHESNGQRVPVSRSWNLLYVSPYFYRPDLLIYLKLRYRFPEEGKDTPESSLGDDNPDITDYYGHSDLHVYYHVWRNHTLHLMVRGNFTTGLGGMSLAYVFPVPKSNQSFFTIRFSHGYGESLVDYRRSLTRVGLGITFVR